MRKTASKHIKKKVIEIIDNIDEFIPGTYTNEVIEKCRAKKVHTNLSDKQLTQLIRLVRIKKRFDLPIALFIDEVAREYQKEVGIQSRIDDISEGLAESLGLKQPQL